MLVVEKMIGNLKRKTIQVEELKDSISDIETNFIGMEFEYEDNFAMVEYIDAFDDYVSLHVENEAGDSWNIELSLDEFLEFAKNITEVII